MQMALFLSKDTSKRGKEHRGSDFSQVLLVLCGARASLPLRQTPAAPSAPGPPGRMPVSTPQ